MATSAYMGKETRKNMKQFRNTDLKTAFGTRNTAEENLFTKDRMQACRTTAMYTSQDFHIVIKNT
jgi:hypothetical protein